MCVCVCAELYISFPFQEDLQQLILMSLPNVAILGQDPLTGIKITTRSYPCQSLSAGRK